MSRWFRHYAGMMRDDKLVRAALKSKQTVERVTWVWSAILESAAEIDDGGRYEIDHAEIAYFLRADEEHIAAIEGALGDLGRLHEGAVAKWASRQFQSDKSAERTKRYRERHRSGSSDHEVTGGKSRDCDVTAEERHSDLPETETETDTTTVSNEPVVVRAKARPEHVQILETLTSVIPEAQAKAVMDHRRKKKSPLNPHSAGLLVKQFQQLEEPAKGADLMMTRGWTGCDPEWCVNAGLKLASSPSQSTGTTPTRVFVKRDSEQWWAWRDFKKSQGKPMPTAITSKADAEDGWWFPSEFPPGHVPSEHDTWQAEGRAA